MDGAPNVSGAPSTLVLKPCSRSELDFALAVEAGSVDVEGGSELGLASLKARHVIQRRQGSVDAAGFDGVADRLELSDVLVVKEIEAFHHEFELALLADVDPLAEAHVRLPGLRVAEGVAAHAVDAAITSVAVHAGGERD